MHYDIEADWHLINTCNYRCEYCFIPTNILNEKIKVTAEPAQWATAFNTTGLTWLLHITGGEPSIYPGFVDLCAQLSQRHFISFNSNLTGHTIKEFSRQIDPTRISFINAGLHPSERVRRSGLEKFLANAKVLLDGQYPLMVSVVATPDVLADFENVVAMLAPINIVPVPKVLRGPYRGRMYPRDYSETDRSRFRALAARANDHYAPLLVRMPERPTIDPLNDVAVLTGIPNYSGRSCTAGRDFVSVSPDGNVFRCSRKTWLGNVLAGSMNLMRAARPCDTGYCFYFCQKYSTQSSRSEAEPRNLHAEPTGYVTSGSF